MTLLTPQIRDALTAGHLAHLVTLNPDGSPQTTVVWTDVEGDEIVTAHMRLHKKVRNVRADPRVSLSLLLGGRNDHGLDHYLVIEGTARVTDGGAVALLNHLGHVYLGPDVDYPPGGGSPEDGYVLRTTPTAVRGVLPWE